MSKKTKKLSQNTLTLILAFLMAIPNPELLLGTETTPPTPPPKPEPCTDCYCKNQGGGGGGGCNEGRCPSGIGASSPSAPSPWSPRPQSTANPVYLRYGSVAESVIDLRLKSPIGVWKMERTYNSLGTGVSALGNKWLGGPTERMLVQDGSDLRFVIGANSSTTFTGTGSPTTYSAPDDSSLQIIHDSTNKEYVISNIVSNAKFIFHDFTVPNSVERGKLKEETTLHWDTLGKSGFEYSYTPSGLISEILTPEGQDYTIAFTYSGSNITKVEIKDDSLNLLQKADYTYYEDVTSASTDLGSSGDLVQVTVATKATKDTASATSVIRTSQYRYDSDSKLKFIFSNENLNRIINSISGISSTDAILTKSNSYGSPSVSSFSDKGFEYYSAPVNTSNISTPFDGSGENLNTLYGGGELAESGMVKKEIIGVGCGTCGTSNSGVTKTYYYTKLDQGVNVDQNEVVRLVIEDTEDSTGTARFRTVYGINDNGLQLRKAFIESPLLSPKIWCTSSTLELSGKSSRTAEQRMPSSHDVSSSSELRQFLDPYDSETNSWSNDDNTLHGSDGVIYVYEHNSSGMRTDAKIKKGKNGTAYYTWAADYGDGDGDLTGDDNENGTLRIAVYRFPNKTTTREDGVKLSYEYTFWDSSDRQIKTMTKTQPQIVSGNNGSGISTKETVYYDTKGQKRWAVDGEGFISYFSYHPVHGNIAYQVVDVDPSTVSTAISTGSAGDWIAWTEGSANTNKPTRDSVLPTPQNLTFQTYYDKIGRKYKESDFNEHEHYTVYEDERSIRFPNWSSVSNSSLMPISIYKPSDGVKSEEFIQVKAGYSNISLSGGIPTGFSVEPSQLDYISWNKKTFDDNGLLKYEDNYHDIPSSGTGTLSANYYRNVFKYDALGRTEYMIKVISGSTASDRKEQVSKVEYDIRNQITAIKTGVSGDSTHDNQNMTDDYNVFPTLHVLERHIYDEGSIGDGLISNTKKYYGTGVNEFVGEKYYHTYRGHMRAFVRYTSDGLVDTTIGPYPVNDLNWNGDTIATAVYDTEPTWSTVLSNDGYDSYASSNATNRRKLTENSIDPLGRTYRIRKHKIISSNGTSDGYLESNMYYDRNNRVVGFQNNNGAGTEYAYDSTGRGYQKRDVLSLSTTKYTGGKYEYRQPKPDPTVSNMTGGDDWVLQLTHREFDKEFLIGTHDYFVNHDDADGAGRGINLTDNDDYIRNTQYRWVNSIGKLAGVAEYGSGDTTAGAGTWKYSTIPTRPSSLPSSSDDFKRVVSFEYNSKSGLTETMTDYDGTVFKQVYDNLGRTVYQIENYDDFDTQTENGSGDSLDKSKDRVTRFTYDGNARTEICALDPNGDGNTSDNQSTVHLYENEFFANLITSIISPNSTDTSSSGTNQKKFSYGLSGTLLSSTDHLGNKIEYKYRQDRKIEFKQVTTISSETDGHIRSIGYSYDDLGRNNLITSYANSDGTGAIRNEVKYTYNDFGQTTEIYQSNEGAVNVSSTPKIEYEYDSEKTGSYFNRGHRMKGVVYPNGRSLFYDYDSTNNDYPSNRLSRIKNIRETDSSGTILSSYQYSGIDQLMTVDLPQPSVKKEFQGGTVGEYNKLDRFGNVIEQEWAGYGSTSDVDRINYSYDTSGKLVSRDIDSLIYSANDKDQTYGQDRLKRLTSYQEGELSGSSITGTVAKEEEYKLDNINRQSGFVKKTAGVTQLDQTRSYDDFNEVSNITESVGTSWATPGYDSSGNMTSIPKPNDLSSSYAAKYDAWGRLVKLTDGSATVAEYEYNGTDHRIVKSIYVSGVLDHKKNVYYNKDWQVLEVRKEVSGVEDVDPFEQYVWHSYYIDALILKDYDENTDGTSTRYYFTQDKIYNVTSAIDVSGNVVERYHYSPQGEMQILDADFSNDADNISDIENSVSFSGRRLDIESGLLHYRYRQYHPQLGQFLTQDPAKFVDGMNIYSYAKSNPSQNLDPLGLESSGRPPGGVLIDQRQETWSQTLYKMSYTGKSVGKRDNSCVVTWLFDISTSVRYRVDQIKTWEYPDPDELEAQRRRLEQLNRQRTALSDGLRNARAAVLAAQAFLATMSVLAITFCLATPGSPVCIYYTYAAYAAAGALVLVEAVLFGLEQELGELDQQIANELARDIPKLTSIERIPGQPGPFSSWENKGERLPITRAIDDCHCEPEKCKPCGPVPEPEKKELTRVGEWQKVTP